MPEINTIPSSAIPRIPIINIPVEQSLPNTQHITRVINQMKKQYLKMQKMFQSSGSVANMNTGSYMQTIFG